MKKQNLLKVFTVTMVVTGISLFIIIASAFSQNFNFGNLFNLLHFMPQRIIQFVGAMNVLTFFPIFVLGILTLGTDGAVGRAKQLITWSIYRYVRNPMYSGVSFSLFGLGLLLGKTGIASAGLLWLCICYLVSLIEERSLTKRFGREYTNYKENTPRFVPKFPVLLKDLKSFFFTKKETKH
ncbi:MAG: isoprenylcysteine carboxylmethyltransferase family protein [Prolixibacteraceae bacterium]|nr:isoprenylcysteine carboxylmethyltransferase family protein [Prolixibacteraceae bacterium]